MLRSRRRFWAVLALLALAVPAIHAQQPGQESNPPNPPYPPLGSTSKTGESGVGTSQGQAGEKEASPPPLTGVQNFALIGPGITHSFFQPSASVFQLVDTNPLGGSASAGEVATITSAFGSFLLQRNSGRTQLALNYIGGATVAHGQRGLNSVVQELAFSQSINWRRWSLLLADQFSYLPESSFGYGGGGIGGAWQLPNYSGIDTYFLPNQSIYTSRGGRIGNTAIGEMQYAVSPRGSLTFSGGYGILRFLETDLLDAGMAMGSAGYSYQISRRDSLGVRYGFNEISFGSVDRRIENHVAQLVYGRNMTGRLAFRAYAGPEFSLIRDQGSHTVRLVDWSVDSSLQYSLRRTVLSLSYSHSITGGAGVIPGAQTDRVDGRIGRALTRMWSGSLEIGYARNQRLDVNALDSFDQRYNTWYGRVGFDRPLGRTAALFLQYDIQVQNSNVPECIGQSCGRSFLRHLITLGFRWSARPLIFE